jgi:hypothetical protein
MVYGLLRALPGEPGFLATIPAQCEALSRVDASVGASGPRGFTVRKIPSFVVRPDLRPPLPAPNVRDDRETPLFIRRGMTAILRVICVFAQASEARHIGTTGKSVIAAKIVSSDKQLLDVRTRSKATGSLTIRRCRA